MTTTHGRLVLFEDRLVIDAAPHVMQRVRALFDGAQRLNQQGKHTHAPVSVARTLPFLRDIAWLIDRYPLEMNEEVAAIVSGGADRYEAMIAAAAGAASDSSFVLSPGSLELAEPLRDHQAKFRNMAKTVRRILLADAMGMGKTISAISMLCEAEWRQALVVVPTQICTQWQLMLKRFLPGATSHVIRGYKTYPLPKADVIITSYNRLRPWEDILCDPKQTWATVIFDEAQDLRHVDTAKREAAHALSRMAKFAIGLTGTPIYNMGDEIWSVIDAISPDALGPRADFLREWCVQGRVRDTVALNSYLRSQGLMLRRTPKELGLDFGAPSKNVVTLDADLAALEKVQDIARLLAISVLSGNVGSSSQAARDLDWRLRHATGVSKAKPVAEFVKMILDEEEKVLLIGWHRDVYDLWLKELRVFNPVMHTGSESPAEKEKAIKAFTTGDARVFILSLRSGAGIDGLQHVCSNVVFGELDWSPHVMDQIVARLDRDGQTRHVNAHYLTVNDGSDPTLLRMLGLKRSQHDGLIEGEHGEASLIAGAEPGMDRIRELATTFLKSIGEALPENAAKGLVADIAVAVRKLRLPANDEAEMQQALNKALRPLLPDVLIEREVKLSKKSRLDFRASRGDERVAIECKVTARDRKEVYKQVRRYASEASVTGVVLIAPWTGVPSFVVDGIRVEVVDPSLASV